MIIEEQISETLIKTYSNNNVLIQKVGTEEKYEGAIDLISNNYVYMETNEIIDTPIDTDKYEDIEYPYDYDEIITEE